MAEKKSLLRIAQKLDVIEEDLEKQEKRIYFSRVEDVREESILILPPFQKGFTMPPRIGRVITAKVVSDRVPYLFEASLLSFISDQLPLWEISQPSRVRKIQMRENVRLSIILNTKMELLDSGREGKVINTLTKDLSGGGMQVVLPENLPLGTKMKISLPLLPDFTLETAGEIVRLLPPVTDSEKLAAGIRFINLDHRIQNQIIKYIFAKECENRQKEKEWMM